VRLEPAGLRTDPAPWNWNRVLTVGTVLKILPVVGLVAWAYWKYLNPFDFDHNGNPDGVWTLQWDKNPAWSHGWLITPLAVVLAHFRLRERPPRRIGPSVWGLAIILAGVVIRLVSATTRHGYPGEAALAVIVAGVLVWLFGWDMLKTLWVSAAYLVLMIPWDQKYYDQIALPLQRASAASTEKVLLLFGYQPIERVDLEYYAKAGAAAGHWILREGNALFLASVPQGLTVVGACSGLHLLFAFVALGVLMAFISRRVWWERLAIVISSFPIAVLCNFVRVTVMAAISDTLFFGRDAMLAGQGTWLSLFGRTPDQLEGIRQAVLDPESFAHQSFGFAMLGLAFLLMSVELAIIERLFIAQESEEKGSGGKAGAEPDAEA